MTVLVGAPGLAQTADTPRASNAADAPAPADSAKPKVAAKGDGWPDLSAFLDEKYGFLPVAMPITEPAIGYGAVGGLAFLSKSLGDASKGLGRPNITFVGGMATANGSWGAFGMDSRYWLDDHLQTLVGGVYASVNLDFHGVGANSQLENNPLRYNLEPKGGLVSAKYRFGETSLWAGFGYAFASTQVSFAAPATTPNLPDYDSRIEHRHGLAIDLARHPRQRLHPAARGFPGGFGPMWRESGWAATTTSCAPG
ncbi:MAG: hypothetical protein WDO74_00800 [Pseudomonadota bacterium]